MLNLDKKGKNYKLVCISHERGVRCVMGIAHLDRNWIIDVISVSIKEDSILDGI